MTLRELYNGLKNADVRVGATLLDDVGFVLRHPHRIGSGYTEVAAYGILEGQYQMWTFRPPVTHDGAHGDWLLISSWKAVPGRKYGAPGHEVELTP